MTDVGIGIDSGPRSGADVWFGIDPRDSQRLLVDYRSGGCTRVSGIGLLCGGLALQAVGLLDGISWGALLLGLVVGPVGAFLVFARSRTIFDRRAGQIEHGFILGTSVVLRRESLRHFDRVTITENTDVSHDEDGDTNYSTTFKVKLVGASQAKMVASTGIWETAVPVAEALSRFLSLPLHDRAADRIRQPEELDLSLRQQKRRHSFKPAGGGMPEDHRSTVMCDDGARFAVQVPRPDGRTMLGLVVVVAVLWTLPVGLLSRSLVVALLPTVLVVASWVKLSFGYSSKVEAIPALLRVSSRGLVLRKTVEIPTDELENLAVRQFEWGGPRNTLAHMFDGFLVARSDRAAARFGHGLSTAELVWLRARLLEVVTASSDASTAKAGSARRRLPVMRRRLRVPLIGAVLGICGLVLLAQGPRNASFWLGWLVAGACVNALLAAGALPLVMRAGWFVRRGRQRSP